MSSNYPGHVKDVNSIRLALSTWVEVKDYLESCQGIILPIGSTEQHGPTGAIGTDALTAEAVALEVGLATGVLVAPAQVYGMAEHHLGFPGTMSLRPETLLEVIHDLVLSLASQGFERVFIINGHGGNIATVKAAFAKAYGSANNRGLSTASKLRCMLANWFMADTVFSETRRLYGDNEGQHATPSEISMTLHLEPFLRQKQRQLPKAACSGPIYGYRDFMERYPDGRMGSDPFLACPEDGATLLSKASQALSEQLKNFLNAS